MLKYYAKIKRLNINAKMNVKNKTWATLTSQRMSKLLALMSSFTFQEFLN